MPRSHVAVPVGIATGSRTSRPPARAALQPRQKPRRSGVEAACRGGTAIRRGVHAPACLAGGGAGRRQSPAR
ncbi:hypothetical protein ABTK76_19645, partial [Acinetobacter baumannii]